MRGKEEGYLHYLDDIKKIYYIHRMIQHIVFVALGGAVGSLLRYYFNYIFYKIEIFNISAGTITANMTGSFLIGLFFGYAMRHQVADSLRLFLVTGILGGFTTFSAFSLENMQLLKDYDIRHLLLNILTQNILGIALASAGYYAGKSISI